MQRKQKSILALLCVVIIIILILLILLAIVNKDNKKNITVMNNINTIQTIDEAKENFSDIKTEDVGGEEFKISDSLNSNKIISVVGKTDYFTMVSIFKNYINLTGSRR